MSPAKKTGTNREREREERETESIAREHMKGQLVLKGHQLEMSYI